MLLLQALDREEADLFQAWLDEAAQARRQAEAERLALAEEAEEVVGPQLPPEHAAGGHLGVSYGDFLRPGEGDR